MTAHWNPKALEKVVDQLETESKRWGGRELWIAAVCLAAGIFMLWTDRAPFAAPSWLFCGYALGLLDGRRRAYREALDQLESQAVDTNS